jgi:hypothetical protein
MHHNRNYSQSTLIGKKRLGDYLISITISNGKGSEYKDPPQYTSNIKKPGESKTRLSTLSPSSLCDRIFFKGYITF